jgi:hypothetical protein
MVTAVTVVRPVMAAPVVRVRPGRPVRTAVWRVLMVVPVRPAAMVAPVVPAVRAAWRVRPVA